MNIKYPFDSNLKHHIIIAIGVAIWVFAFLYFTEPLDVSELNNIDKLTYLPLYGIVGALSYSIFLPLQYFLFKKSNKSWRLKHELIFIISLSVVSILLARAVYLFIVVRNEPNPHDFIYMIKSLFLPALAIILPIVIIGRFAFGKYHEKKLEDQKIEIKGEGNYESLRLLLNDLISIQSSDNYIEVLYLSGQNLKKSLIRNKLSSIDDTFPELLRTHRSNIINPYHFQSWKTEKGKHFLMLSYEIEVPISKTYLEVVKSTLNFTTE